MPKNHQRVLWEYRQHANLWTPLPDELFLETTAAGEVRLPPYAINCTHAMVLTNDSCRHCFRPGEGGAEPPQRLERPFRLHEEELQQLGYVTFIDLAREWLNQ